ncbi:hypothetical protein SAPIO_CDS6784 [Scedosporium apiospermum]|uniref:Uncharacterized protein n=1 Tax=Pseudallescheria apiosperma TaxID=563466 RepID=A0A084G384_PSEDA|nr:uncharacterized protein SAPIO_CDS6784 [Scedosporium apiospermum]KEZ41796.1 hypothetical protein SAPIO_CDS6784 [Scedosporium apiospermum]
MNTTLDCETFKEFSAINDAANHTQLFMECPELCTVAFGTGNPDLGGIGLTREVAVDGYEDDEWGFGQVLAVFAWAPTLTEWTLWLFRVTIRHREDSWRSWDEMKRALRKWQMGDLDGHGHDSRPLGNEDDTELEEIGSGGRADVTSRPHDLEIGIKSINEKIRRVETW